MLKRVLWVLYAAGILLVVGIQIAAASETGTVPVTSSVESSLAALRWAGEESSQLAVTVGTPISFPENGNPKTGDHPAPIWGAMGLVLSGVVLVMLADGKHRKE